MDREEQRKRAFSQAFQHMNQPRYSDLNAPPAKRVHSHPLGATALHLPEFGHENEAPLDWDSRAAFDNAPSTRIRHTAPVDLQYFNPAHYNHASLQCELYGNSPGPEVECEPGSSPPPLKRDRRLTSPARHHSLPTTPIVRGQSMFAPSPYIRPDLVISLGDVIGSYAQPVTEPSPMSDVSTVVDPLTPSALNFGELTLKSEGYSIPSSPLWHGNQGGRATVRLMPVGSFARHFSELKPNEAVVLFDKGKSLLKANKYPLCSASRIFAHLLDDPFLDHDLIRCIRLRDDFPYAITTMFHFIETGYYMFDQRAFAAYPLLTALDFHVHTYLAGSKYGLLAFRDHAINGYVGIAEHELRSGFLAAFSDQPSDVQIAMAGFPVVTPLDEQAGGETVISPIDRFLNSLILLWRNTQSRLDSLRKAVLELIKRHFGKLLREPFFITLLQEIVGLGDDILASLGDDGFDVKAFQVPRGARVNQTIRF